jgi:hypothetical protein
VEGNTWGIVGGLGFGIKNITDPIQWCHSREGGNLVKHVNRVVTNPVVTHREVVSIYLIPAFAGMKGIDELI